MTEGRKQEKRMSCVVVFNRIPYSLNRPSEYMLHIWQKCVLSIWLYMNTDQEFSMAEAEQGGESERTISRFTCGKIQSVYKMGNVNASALHFQSNVNEPNQVVITGFS